MVIQPINSPANLRHRLVGVGGGGVIGGGRREGLFYGKVVANWQINLLFCFRA